MTVHARKLVILRETVRGELGAAAAQPITRAVGLAAIANPFAGRSAEDLSELFQSGAAIGEFLIEQLVPLLPSPVVSYGKGAIVGLHGEMEHGGGMYSSDARKADPSGSGRRQIADSLERESRARRRLTRCSART